MPKELPNVYENVKEAMLRLRRTVVVYDRQPYVVLAITNHKNDNIFRIYLDPTAKPKEQMVLGRPEPENFPPEHAGLGPYMDQWITDNPSAGVLRKQMNSPLFNKFRPYPLGMCNIKGSGCSYLERMPNRKTEQGLLPSMINETTVNVVTNKDQGRALRNIDIYGPAFKDCVIGTYPSAQDCLTNLLHPDITNEAAAFHREFALVRGPLNMLFLAYKHEIVGVLPKNNFEMVRLGHEYGHTKEVVEQLGLFQSIIR